MHSFHKTKIMSYDAKFIHDIVMDIENYPAFVPWCKSATILSYEKDHLIAELNIQFKMLSESYVSRVSARKTDDNYEIVTTAIAGPFKRLISIWKIKSINNSTEVQFSIDFEFKSRILEAIMGSFFSIATERMVAAFEARARDLSCK